MPSIYLIARKKRRNILNTTLLTRMTAHKQWGSKHKHHMQSLGNDENE